MMRVKPIAVFNKMVSSKMGFLEEGSGNAFSHYRSKSNFAEPHVIHFKPISVSNKTVSSKRGSLGGGPWDAFFPYRSNSNFKRTPISSTLSRLQFGTKRFHPKGGP